MMLKPSNIQPDIELRDALQNQISVGLAGGGTKTVPVFGDWERPTNELPDDFLVVFINGDPQGVSMDTPFAKGYIMVSVYSRLNDDSSVKKNRVQKILAQFETIIEDLVTDNYHFEYDASRFITPTTPNFTSGYSLTTLNLRWATTNSFNK